MAKLRITAVEGQHQGEVFEAQFNPKEIDLDRAIPWQQQSRKGPADLEFARAEPAQMAFELLFDGAETAKSVQPQLDKLREFSSVDANLHRPPKVKVSWGNTAGVMPTFDGVIESIAVRYVMFAESGVPVRATVDVKLKEAANLKVHAP
jgi:Contractile injection system tube protein